MTLTSYAEIAGTRPRVRRDVLFTQTPNGVIFHNADGGFQLTAKSGYRFASVAAQVADVLLGEEPGAGLTVAVGGEVVPL
ncbi:hypothetical protein ACWD5B_18000, partial [Streptomyces tanashiensis]